MRIGRLTPVLTLVLLHLFFLPVVDTAMALKAQGNGVVYPLPQVESGEIVTRWLKANGFTVQRRTTANGSVRLIAKMPSIEFELILRANSALATYIEHHSESISSTRYVDMLKSYLDRYVRSPGSYARPDDYPIPGFVRIRQKAVVCIFSDVNNHDYQFTGFVVDQKGLIVCTAHDLIPDQQVLVTFYDGRGIKGQVIRIDRARDLSLVKVKEPLETQVSLRDGRFVLQHGDLLFGVNCLGLALGKIQKGFVDGPPRRVEQLPLWQVQMHIDPGSSGSPVFDEHGRLAAIVKGRYRGTDSVGFLIPFETLLHFLDRY